MPVSLNKSTRYALYASLELARAAADEPVPVSWVAERYRIPEAPLAKVLQQLVHAGLAAGTRGVGGGYRLTRLPSQITVLDVMAAFEPPREPGACLLDDAGGDCHALGTCRLRRLFDEVDELARATYASTTLETLVRAPEPTVVLGG